MGDGGGRRARARSAGPDGTARGTERASLGLLMVVWGLVKAADWALVLVVSVAVLDLGGAAAVGVAGALRVAPGALLSPLVPVVADRYPRARVLAGALAVWGALAAALAGLSVTGAPLPAWFLVLALSSVAGSLVRPCVQGLLPQLVRTPAGLVRATSAYTTVSGAGTVVGPLLSGLLLGPSGRAPVLLALAGVLLGAGLVALGVRTASRPPRRPARGGGPGLWAGAAVLLRPGARDVVAVLLGRMLLSGFVGTAVVVLALDVLDGGEDLLGALYAAGGAGGLLGVVAVVGGRSPVRATAWFVAGASACGAAVAVVGLSPHPAVALVALGVVGLGAAANDVHGLGVLGRLLPDHLAGRGWGALQGACAAASAVGSLLVAPLVALAGLPLSLVLLGAAAALAPLLLWPRLRRFHEALGPDHPLTAVLGGVPLLAPLSAMALDRLARGASEHDLGGGDVVVRQGEPGDSFFVVLSGGFDVVQDGRTIGSLGDHDWFGEVSLLREVPRTATVVATRPGRLVAVDAPTFVAVVTGHRHADARARERVRGLLDDDERRGRPEPVT